MRARVKVEDQVAMSDTDSIPFGAVMAADILSVLGIPGGATLAKFADNYVARRRSEAANILIKEIRGGRHGEIHFEEYDLDPLLQMTMRFSKAIDEGAARQNLRLLAQVIAGLKKNKAFDPDKFRRWCGIVEHLTRDELMVLGHAHTIAVKLRGSADESNSQTFVQALGDDLEAAGYARSEIAALFVSVARTGVFVPMPAVGSINYLPSPWLFELGELADLEFKNK